MKIGIITDNYSAQARTYPLPRGHYPTLFRKMTELFGTEFVQIQPYYGPRIKSWFDKPVGYLHEWFEEGYIKLTTEETYLEEYKSCDIILVFNMPWNDIYWWYRGPINDFLLNTVFKDNKPIIWLDTDSQEFFGKKRKTYFWDFIVPNKLHERIDIWASTIFGFNGEYNEYFEHLAGNYIPLKKRYYCPFPYDPYYEKPFSNSKDKLIFAGPIGGRTPIYNIIKNGIDNLGINDVILYGAKYFGKHYLGEGKDELLLKEYPDIVSSVKERLFMNYYEYLNNFTDVKYGIHDSSTWGFSCPGLPPHVYNTIRLFESVYAGRPVISSPFYLPDRKSLELFCNIDFINSEIKLDDGESLLKVQRDLLSGLFNVNTEASRFNNLVKKLI